MSAISSPPDEKPILEDYERLVPLYRRLIEEVRFILERSIQNKGIKIHAVQHRVKDFPSLYNKIVLRKIREDFFGKIADIAGIRLIGLYRSDLARIADVITTEFEVVEADVKTKATREMEFGYMSDHYIVKLPETCRGPRYDDIATLKCEIQVRTILMDAWDSVSHHLDYKQELDIPSSLRRDFYALSGLFYVADTHFEMFRDSVENLKSKLAQSIEEDRFDLSQEMNLETLRAFLRWKSPEREASEMAHYSEFLEELKRFGYTNLERLNGILDKRMSSALEKEKADPPFEVEKGKPFGRTRYTDVGIARLCLRLHDQKYTSYLRLQDQKYTTH